MIALACKRFVRLPPGREIQCNFVSTSEEIHSVAANTAKHKPSHIFSPLWIEKLSLAYPLNSGQLSFNNSVHRSTWKCCTREAWPTSTWTTQQRPTTPWPSAPALCSRTSCTPWHARLDGLLGRCHIYIWLYHYFLECAVFDAFLSPCYNRTGWLG